MTHLRPSGRLDCSDGQVLHDWCLQGLGIAWRSTWEVEHEIAAGRLRGVLDDFAAPPNGIYAVFPQRKHLPLRVRLWIDFIKHSYGDAAYWTAAAVACWRRALASGGRLLGRRHSLMNVLRSSPFLSPASLLQVVIFVCCVSFLADRQSFMKALRSSPFLSPASLLQVAILLCCAVGSAAWAAPDGVEQSVLQKWLRAPFNLDGWRIDVAHMTGRQADVDLNHEVARLARGAVIECRAGQKCWSLKHFTMLVPTCRAMAGREP